MSHVVMLQTIMKQCKTVRVILERVKKGDLFDNVTFEPTAEGGRE